MDVRRHIRCLFPALILISASLLSACAGGSGAEKSVLTRICENAVIEEADRSFAGVIPCRLADSGWGALDEDGNVLIPFEYEGLGGISYAGMTIFTAGDEHFVYDGKGDLRYSGIDEVGVAGDGYTVLKLQDDGSRLLGHYMSDGTVIDDETSVITEQEWNTTATDRSDIRSFTLTDDKELEKMPEDELDFNSYVQMFYCDGAYESSVSADPGDPSKGMFEVWSYIEGAALVLTGQDKETVPGTGVLLLAVHDSISMSGEKYWPYMDDGVWRYMDHQTGKTAASSGSYDMASGFRKGYAVVIKDKEASVINKKFKTVQKIGNAESVRLYGDVFCISSRDDEGVRLYRID